MNDDTTTSTAPRLDAAHVSELIQGSGVALAVALAAGLWSESDPGALARMVGGSKTRWTDAHLPALVFPYRFPGETDAAIFRVKPLSPMSSTTKEGVVELAKYVSPPKWATGQGVRLYFPPSLLSSERRRRDVAVPLLVTEGEKKTLAADSAGFACVGLSGVSCWSEGKGKKRRLHRDFAHLELRARRIYVVFDSDASTNLLGVRREERLLADALRAAGADPHIVRLPHGAGGAKQGLDDFLVAQGADALRALCRGSKPSGEEPRRATSSGVVQLEIHAAARLVERHGADLRYAAGIGWLYWTGTHWQRDTTETSRELTKKIADELRIEAAKSNNDDLWKLTQKIGTSRGVTALLDSARSDPRVRISANDLDSHPFLLTVENGTVDLRSGELLPHDRGHLLTRCAPTIYDPSAAFAPLEKLLTHLIPDPEARTYLQRAIGYSLTSVVSEDVIFLLVGPPRSGKGTLLRALHETLGEHFAAAAMRSFCVNKSMTGGNQARSDLYRLIGRRIVAASEIHPGLEFDVGMLKGLAGGDRFPVRDLREKEIEARVTFTLWLVANDGDLPTMRSEDDALWERVRRIPIGTTVPESERDPAFRESFGHSEARQAMLTWAVAGAVAWFASGLGSAPSTVRAASAALRESMDPIAEFVAEMLTFEAWAVASRTEIREAFESFFDGDRMPSAKRIAAGLRSAGERAGVAVSTTTKREGSKIVRAWKGVRLATTHEREARSAAGRRHVDACSHQITYEPRARVEGVLDGTASTAGYVDTARRGDAYEPSEGQLTEGAADFDPTSFGSANGSAGGEASGSGSGGGGDRW